jgi:hypothetical protein
MFDRGESSIDVSTDQIINNVIPEGLKACPSMLEAGEIRFFEA